MNKHMVVVMLREWMDDNVLATYVMPADEAKKLVAEQAEWLASIVPDEPSQGYSLEITHVIQDHTNVVDWRKELKDCIDTYEEGD